MNDDLISRQAAIDAVETVIGDNRSISVCKAIRQLPPIQPKTGRWKHVEIESDKSDVGYFLLPLCECSVCDLYVEQESNYCPHCGARMKGV